MNGHRASCILRYRGQPFRAVLTDNDRLGVAQFPFLLVAGAGYKTFQILRVQPKNGRRIFLQGIRRTAYGSAVIRGSYEE